MKYEPMLYYVLIMISQEKIILLFNKHAKNESEAQSRAYKTMCRSDFINAIKEYEEINICTCSDHVLKRVGTKYYCTKCMLKVM